MSVVRVPDATLTSSSTRRAAYGSTSASRIARRASTGSSPMRPETRPAASSGSGRGAEQQLVHHPAEGHLHGVERGGEDGREQGEHGNGGSGPFTEPVECCRRTQEQRQVGDGGGQVGHHGHDQRADVGRVGPCRADVHRGPDRRRRAPPRCTAPVSPAAKATSARQQGAAAGSQSHPAQRPALLGPGARQPPPRGGPGPRSVRRPGSSPRRCRAPPWREHLPRPL